MSFVPAVMRASALLDLVALEGPMPLSQIARKLDLPKSTVHGLCQTLCHLGLLFDGPRGFTIGGKALFWAGRFHQESVLVEAFEAQVAADETLAALSVTLSVLEGAEVVYLACHNSSKPLGITFRTGMRVPAPFSATGKALLAALSHEDLAERLQSWPAPFTPHSLPSLEVLLAQLEEVRGTGLGIDRGEMREGMICMGAQISGADGRPVGAVALSMTAAECTPQKEPFFAAQVKSLTASISKRVFST